MREIRAVIFDYGGTLSSARYFSKPHPAIPAWQQFLDTHLWGNPALIHAWSIGQASLADVAQHLSARAKFPSADLCPILRDGCVSLPEHPSVMAFVRTLHAAGIPLALVTVNYDVFTEVVSPSACYPELFPVILNSADAGTADKRALWLRAFRALGSDIGYENSLLIEDSAQNVRRFRSAGGAAIRYTGEKAFAAAVSDIKVHNKRLILSPNLCCR